MIFLVAGMALRAAGMGFDSGMTAPALVARLDAGDPFVAQAGAWVHVRGVVESGSQVAEQAALAELHRRGLRVCVLLMPTRESWATGLRSWPGATLPLDLREAHDRMMRLASSYRGLVDAWEIGNEPDIGFVPENAENYMAYLKACYLGAREGALNGQRSAISDQSQKGRSFWWHLWRRLRGGSGSEESRFPSPVHRPLIIMAPLALPPGPYLERLIGNGLLSYTDGFNFHYYGYARDFTGVYRQFENAVENQRGGDNTFRLKRLPVFITEFGYGLLDGVARETVAGRVRQWAWFRDVNAQIRELRIAAPMAFLLTPYFERGVNEFGLTAPETRQEAKGERREGRAGDPRGQRPRLQLGAMEFKPQDFGAKKAEPWMELIGKPVAGGEATPALAWLMADAKPGHPSRDWTVSVPDSSPVVIDFVAGVDALPYKSYQGFMLMDSGRGHGELRLYNFSAARLSGSLRMSGSAAARAIAPASLSDKITLEPGAMVTIPLELETSDADFSVHSWTVDFLPDNSTVPPATFTTAFFPNATGMTKTVQVQLDHDEKSAERNYSRLLQRELAVDEPRLVSQGRWLVTPGVKVTEDGTTWSFEVTGYPPEPLRPAMAELPLLTGFKFPPGGMFTFDYHATLPLENDRQEAMEMYFRTANGNLFHVWPPFPVTDLWQTYTQNRENFTMGFFGRAALPWQFEKNECVSLVFYFRPHRLPTTYEIRNAEIVSWKK